MRLHNAGKYSGDESSLPQRDHPEGYIDGIGTVIERAVHTPARRAEPKFSVDDACVRSVVVDRDLLRKGMEIPVAQVAARKKAVRHRRKQIIPVPEKNQARIGRLPISAAPFPAAEKLVPVGQIQGIAIIRSAHSITPFPPFSGLSVQRNHGIRIMDHHAGLRQFLLQLPDRRFHNRNTA